MCIIAGYNGTKRAAPLIIEMLRKTEGIDAGCYTGIATLHEGKIHYRKLAGNLDRLLAETDAMDLPGNIGIIHSRTPGGHNGDSWAHPFTHEKEGDTLTAMVLNGIGGCRAEAHKNILPKKLREILAAPGYELKSKGSYDGKEKHLPHCDDEGNMYHISDMVCQNVSRKIFEEGMTPTLALEKSYEELGGENVVLMLSVTTPEVINYCRLNFPMFVGFADHGACLATVPLAFAEHTEKYHLLPALSTGTVTKDGFTVQKMPNPPFTVAPITPKVMGTAWAKVPDYMARGERPFSPAFIDAFEKADCTEKNAVSWMLLTEYYKQGKLDFEKELLPGVREGLLKTKFNFIWKG